MPAMGMEKGGRVRVMRETSTVWLVVEKKGGGGEWRGRVRALQESRKKEREESGCWRWKKRICSAMRELLR